VNEEAGEAEETVAMTHSQAADLAADTALANESLTSARLLIATDRVGDEAGHSVEGYLAEAQESTRRLYGALVTAQGIQAGMVEAEGGTAGAGARDAERLRLLYLLEQAQAVADRIDDEGGLDHAQVISELVLRVRTEVHRPKGRE